MNPRLEPIGGLPIDEVRGPLAARLAKLLPGRGARPSRGEAEAFYAMYRPSNEALRQRHLPGRARLFDEDFSAYPDVADPMDFAIGDLAGVAAMLQTAATREARRLEAEIAIRDARLHWLRQEPAAAELAIGRALAWSPDHPDAYRALAENLLRQGRLDEALAAAGRAVEHRPESHEFWHFLGILRRRTGDFDGAAEAQRQALARAPDHAGAQAELAQINSRQQRTAVRCLPASSKRGRSLPKTTFSLTGDALAALDKVGLRLPGLRLTRHLATGSRIEGPTSIISTVAPGAFLDVGAFCNLSGGTINNVRFGRYCSVASGVVVGPHEHPTDWLTTSRIAYYPEVNGWDALVAGPNLSKVHALHRPFPESCPTTEIGPDVWIGQGAFIKSGVTIGAGAIIGARATVLRDVPPYGIVVGTPARVLRLRFPEATVERLLALRWWRYSLYDLFEAPMDSIDAALDAIEALVAAGAVKPYVGPDVGPGPRRPAGAGGVARGRSYGEGQLTGSRIRSRSRPTLQPGPSRISTR